MPVSPEAIVTSVTRELVLGTQLLTPKEEGYIDTKDWRSSRDGVGLNSSGPIKIPMNSGVKSEASVECKRETRRTLNLMRTGLPVRSEID